MAASYMLPIQLTSSPGSVTIINTASHIIEKTISIAFDPYGIDLSPDGSLLYVEPINGANMSVISTTTDTYIGDIPVSSPFSFGNFISAGIGCSSMPVTYTITVNPTNVSPPTITATTATGTISACAGSASVSPQIQQFTVSGSGLTGNIIATAPAGFEVSLAAGSGYGSSVSIPQNSGTVNSTVVYVRSAATAPAGSLSGDVTLTSTGASNQTVAVTGMVKAVPTVNAVANQSVNNGAATTAVNFTGTGNTFSWVNDTPGIGLAVSGTGNIASFTAVNTGSSAVKATITVMPAFKTLAYLANEPSAVSVIDVETNGVIATIPVGTTPYGVSVSRDGSRVYVGNQASNNVSVINTATNKVIATVPVGGEPAGVVVSPDGSKVYVANFSAGTVSVINTATNTVIATVTTEMEPYGISISPDGRMVYVANQHSASVSVINAATNTVVATIPVGNTPEAVAASPDGSQVYVTNTVSNNVSVINTATNTVIATVGVGQRPLTISNNGNYAYVVNQESSNVSVINTAANTVVSTITVGSNPFGVSVSPDGNRVYVENLGSNNVSVINTATNTVITTIPVSNAISFGNFIMGSTGCPGIPITFTITVNSTIPTITATTATGTISACVGTTSASPQIQQFTVTGSGLTGNITTTAPPGFEVSLSAGSGYAGSVTIPQTSGAVSGTVVYVRSSAGDAPGGISGNVTLTSAGVSNQTVAVTGTVNALPTVNAVANQSVNNGVATAAVNFTGTGNTFTWVNDTPGIGLPASGTGNIPSFTAVNTGNTPVVAGPPLRCDACAGSLCLYN